MTNRDTVINLVRLLQGPNQIRVRNAVRRLLQEAIPDSGEVAQMVRRIVGPPREADVQRRGQIRTPFCCTTELILDEHDTERMPAYVRDVNVSGIGFLHSMPLELDEVTSTFRLRNFEVLRLRLRICWCRRCSKRWYISGGQFLWVVDN